MAIVIEGFVKGEDGKRVNCIKHVSVLVTATSDSLEFSVVVPGSTAAFGFLYLNMKSIKLVTLVAPDRSNKSLS